MNTIQVTDNVTLKAEEFERLTELSRNYMNEFMNMYVDITEQVDNLSAAESNATFYILFTNSIVEGMCKTDYLLNEEEAKKEVREFGKELLIKWLLEGDDSV